MSDETKVSTEKELSRIDCQPYEDNCHVCMQTNYELLQGKIDMFNDFLLMALKAQHRMRKINEEGRKCLIFMNFRCNSFISTPIPLTRNYNTKINDTLSS